MRYTGMRRRKKTAVITDITLTPLIDTALTLLIIFMVAAPMVHNAIRVQLPKGVAQEVKGVKQECVVEVDAHGDIVFEKKSMPVTSLLEILKHQLKDDDNKVVFIKADTNVSYGVVLELVDTLKSVGGIRYVALATQKHIH